MTSVGRAGIWKDPKRREEEAISREERAEDCLPPHPPRHPLWMLQCGQNPFLTQHLTIGQI